MLVSYHQADAGGAVPSPLAKGTRFRSGKVPAVVLGSKPRLELVYLGLVMLILPPARLGRSGWSVPPIPVLW